MKATVFKYWTSGSGGHWSLREDKQMSWASWACCTKRISWQQCREREPQWSLVISLSWVFRTYTEEESVQREFSRDLHRVPSNESWSMHVHERTTRGWGMELSKNRRRNNPKTGEGTISRIHRVKNSFCSYQLESKTSKFTGHQRRVITWILTESWSKN